MLGPPKDGSEFGLCCVPLMFITILMLVPQCLDHGGLIYSGAGNWIVEVPQCYSFVFLSRLCWLLLVLCLSIYISESSCQLLQENQLKSYKDGTEVLAQIQYIVLFI